MMWLTALDKDSDCAAELNATKESEDDGVGTTGALETATETVAPQELGTAVRAVSKESASKVAL